MKVLFLETVEGSGTRGEVRTVTNGYARNYLLPRGYAAPATPAILKQAERLAAEEEVRQRSLDEQALQLVGKLQGQTLVCAVRVGEQGRLYGSVTNADVAEKAGEILGEELDRRRVLLPEVIRHVGVYSVSLRLSRNVTAVAQVVVVDADAPQGVDAAVAELLAVPEMVEPDVPETVTQAYTSGAEGVTAAVSEPGSLASEGSASDVDDEADDDDGDEADDDDAPAGSTPTS